MIRTLTYKDVADKLGVAESTVKRWFATASFDIERLNDFAVLLNMDFSELFAVKRTRMLLTSFTEDQELELAHNEGLLSVLYLAFSGVNHETMLAHFEISPAKLQSYLVRLDHLGLIELHPGNRIVPLVRANTRWLPGGPLNETYGETLRHSFMDTQFSGSREFFWLVSGKASNATLQVFSRKLEILLNELQDLMDLDLDLPDSEAPSITFLCGPSAVEAAYCAA